jgi:hypothetical protein
MIVRFVNRNDSTSTVVCWALAGVMEIPSSAYVATDATNLVRPHVVRPQVIVIASPQHSQPSSSSLSLSLSLFLSFSLSLPLPWSRRHGGPVRPKGRHHRGLRRQEVAVTA